MKQKKGIIRLQFKLILSAGIRSVLISVALLGIVFILISTFAKQYFEDDRQTGIVKIGVVTEDYGTDYNGIIRLVNAFESIKSFCVVVPMEEEEALSELQQGNIPLYIRIPSGFMEDAEHMKDVQLTVVRTEEESIAANKISALLSGVGGVMTTTENTIRAFYGHEEYLNKSIHAVEDDVMQMYVSAFFKRSSLYDTVYYSSYGNINVGSFYIMSAITLIILIVSSNMLSIFGNGYFELISNRFTNVTDKILIFGTAVIQTGFVIAVELAAIVMIVRRGLVLLSDDSSHIYTDYLEEFIRSYITPFSFLSIFLAGMAISCVIWMFVILIDNKSRRVLMYALTIITGVMLSGVIGSQYYLPAFIRPFRNIWTSGSVHTFLIDGFLTGEASRNWISASLTVLVIVLIDMILYIRMTVKR
ncbi:MAG: ABC transporter permease [Lachnospiraceae bacterium]|nr:ABC transporter permease [Lachnospiraceae bacterium]